MWIYKFIFVDILVYGSSYLNNPEQLQLHKFKDGTLLVGGFVMLILGKYRVSV